mmetsp:Transcript_28081/g.90531  ORF Transcript_28081/g.90531 Transcript_28081/m.90531 type:complete len:362 (+) Transcript_28081:318-1403(+)
MPRGPARPFAGQKRKERGFLKLLFAFVEDAFDAFFVEFCLGHPEFGAFAHDVGEDGAAEEDEVLPAGWVLDAHLEFFEALFVALQDFGEVALGDVSFEAGGEAGVHGGAAGEDDVLVVFGAGVDVGGLYHVEDHVSHALGFDVDEGGLEEGFRGFEALAAELDDAAVGEGVGFLENRRFLGELPFLRDVVGDVAELFLDLADGFEVGGAIKGVASEEEEFDEVPRDVAAGDVEPADQVLRDEAVVDRDDVRHAVARVDDAAREEALGVEGQHGLDRHVAVGEAIGLEHVGHELAAVRQGIHRRLRQHDLKVLRIDPELLVEGVIPEQLHVVPVLHDPVLHGVGAVQRHPHRGGLVAAHDFL